MNIERTGIMTYEERLECLRTLDRIGEKLVSKAAIDMLDDVASKLADEGTDAEKVDSIDAYTWGRLVQWEGSERYKHVVED